MNIENYKITLNEFLIILRNTCSYVPEMDYEFISFMVKQEAIDYISKSICQKLKDAKCTCHDINIEKLENQDKDILQEFVDEMQRILNELVEKHHKEMPKITPFHSN